MKADVRISNNAKFLHDLALSTCTRAMVQTQISLMTDIQNFPTAISTTSTIYSIKREKKKKKKKKIISIRMVAKWPIVQDATLTRVYSLGQAGLNQAVAAVD
jgi:hypothetical protein